MRSLFRKLLARSDENNAAASADYEPDPEKLKKHGEAVMQALGAAVDCLEDALVLNSVLLALGQAHCAFHVRPEHVMRLWPAIDYAMERKLGPLYTREVQKAWLSVYRYIAEKMVLGIQMRRSEMSIGVDD
uniref:GLOBIN domain-containing protein n=1 Tax=Macrostomum lignano TaxID=282301 RepID=A0A1I8GPP4_9PLAT